MSRAALGRPILHGGGHYAGHLQIEPLAPLDRPHEARECFLGEPLPHDLAAEDIAAEKLVDALDLRGTG